MAHPIEPGPIGIVSIHNPSCYWVSCCECVTGSKMAAALESLKLQQHPEPRRGDRVVINRFGRLTRGILQRPTVTEGLDQIRLWEAYCLDIVQTVSVPAYGILKPEGESDILQLPEQVHLIALEDCYSLMVEKLPIPCHDESFIDQIELTKEVLRGNRLVLEKATVSTPSNLTFGKITLYANEVRVPLVKALAASLWLVLYEKNYMEALEEHGLLDEMKQLVEEVKLKISPPPKKFPLRPLHRSKRPSSEAFRCQTDGNLLKMLRGDLDLDVNFLRASAWTETLDEYNNRLRLITDDAKEISSCEPSNDETSDATSSEIIETSANSQEELLNGEESVQMEEEELSQFEDAEESSEIAKVFKNDSSRKYVPDIYDESDEGSWDYADDLLCEDSSMEWEKFGDVLRMNKPNSTGLPPISIRESSPSGRDDLKEQILSPSCPTPQVIDSDSSALKAFGTHCMKNRAETICDFGRGKLFRSNKNQIFGPVGISPRNSGTPSFGTGQSNRQSATNCDDHSLPRPSKSESTLGSGRCSSTDRFQHEASSIANDSTRRGRGCLLKPSTSETHAVPSSRPPSGLSKGRGNLLGCIQERRSSTFPGRLRAGSTSSSCSGISARESSTAATSIEDKRSSADLKYSNGMMPGADGRTSPRKIQDEVSLLEQSEKIGNLSSKQSSLTSLNAESQPSSTVSSSSQSSSKFPSPDSSDKTESDSSVNAGAVLSRNSDNLSTDDQFQDAEEDSTSNDDDVRTSKSDIPLENSHPKEILESLRNASCAGILHGNESIRPVKYLAELHLHQTILAGSKKVDMLTRPQKLAMPAILDRRNVVIIAPNHCRKTTGFIIPILNLLFDEEYYSGLRKGLGPRCVLVAPTSSRVKKLGKLCSIHSQSRLRTIMTYGGGLEVEQKNQLAEGCDILVTTPRCWLRLLQYSTATNLIRVCHVVLDSFDELSSRFMNELREISAKVEFLTKERKQSSESLPGVQTVVAGTQWSARVEGLTFKILHKPVLVITSFLEASLYARIKPIVSVLKIGGKRTKVAELVKKHAEMKTVVVCNCSQEVDEVLNACSPSKPTFTAHDEMSPTVLSDVNHLWSCASKPPLLICSDGVVNELNIMDAQVLINYSLPLNKTSFSERYQLLRAYIPDRIVDPEASAPDVTVHIFFDESSEEPFPIIVDFLQRIPVKLPDKVLTVAKNIERGKELTKFDAPFCDNILQMGFCPNSSGCKERHVIQKEIDLAENGLDISQKFVKVLILRVHSAVKFSVRILSSTANPSGAGSWEQCSSQWGTFPAKMASYFSTSMNLRLHSDVKVGDLVAYQSEPGDIVYRARVRAILKKNDRGEPTSVSIFLIDECDTLVAQTHLIYELPEQFENFPPQACYLYLANLKPVDLDTTWNYAAFRAVERAVYGEMDRDYADEEIIGKVLFCIGQNVVVENLRWFRQLEFSRVVSCDLRKLILDSKFGLPNPDYSENMTLHCKEGGLLHNDIESDKTQALHNAQRLRLIPSQEKDVPPRWAHLPLPDEFESDLREIYHRVAVSAVESPSLFFVKLSTHNSSLQELESMIAAEIEKTVKPLRNPCVGGLCFAKLTNETESSPKGIYRRCKIQWLDMEKKTATVFFVDYGSDGVVPLASLYKAPWSLMIRIPFQAIECTMAGVKATSKTGWPTEATEAFKAWTKPHGDDEPAIFVKVVAFDQHAEWTDGKRYHLAMVHVHNNRCDLLNERMIDRLWANWETEALKLEAELNSEVLLPTVSPLEEDVKEEPFNEETLNFDFDECDESELNDFFAALIDGTLPKPSAEMAEMISDRKGGPKAICGTKKKKRRTRPPVDTLGAAAESVHDDMKCASAVHPNPEISLSAVAGFLTPFVRWKQDYRTVSLSYLIPATKNFVVHPSPTRLVFSAIVESQDGGEKKYFSSVDFFGLVQTANVKVDESHSSIRVSLQKVVCSRAILWPRLTRKLTTDSRIRGYDDEESGEDQDSPVAAPSTKGRYRPAGSDDEFSSDDETSDDDDCKEGWDDLDFFQS
ncbi:regulation of transposition, RNA-mediated [Nesidiocoris tenuis]|uniref:RNA helicase n=1 Tax=Nesidiocoris tenuis TaxID=355587 RepID=A0ABN7AB05_9HEMI|nr:regulation of transposition, RNA-mediated [Nesidiocoris tenuis]